MFTDPKVYQPDDLSQRAHISFYFNGKRYRYYNGKALSINCFPNMASSLKERNRLLTQLCRLFTRALIEGWSPERKLQDTVKEAQQKPLKDVLEQLQQDMQHSSYSNTYKRDIANVINRFIHWLSSERKEDALVNQIQTADIERFLQQFSSSGTYYQNKRRTLAAVFAKRVKQGQCMSNPVVQTTKRKVKAVLHQTYTPDQLTQVLVYLKEYYPNLYLCALLMYGLLLRPHQEVRLLRRGHLSQGLDYYVLDGNENKSGRIRSLPVPEYVRAELLCRKVDLLHHDDYVLTGAKLTYNESYFNTMWSRAKKKMLELQIITSNQTLYSFRHAASVNVFERSQNLKLLQQLLGHSSLHTSLVYLRSLGQVQLDHAVMPELTIIK